MANAVRRVHLGIDDQNSNRYPRFPFEVPIQTDAIAVTVSFDAPDAVIDLGCEGAAGWRGWSGGARKSFVIGADTATPGYMPGPLEAGTWHVVLGLHKIPPSGVEVEIRCEAPTAKRPHAEPQVPPLAFGRRPPKRNLAVPGGMRWYAGDFHAHTTHSDGSLTIAQLAHEAASAGLEFLAVTDHNTTSHHSGLPRVAAEQGLTLIPGQEVTTPRGHANAFGDIGWIDFREDAQRWVSEVAARGGILSVNHPLADDCAWQHPLTALPPALELWHISWYRNLTDTGPWAFAARWRKDAVVLGGSDFHRPDQGRPLGLPTTWVAAEENSPEAILAGVRAGRTAISIGLNTVGHPDPQHAPLLLPVGEDLLCIDAEGAIAVDMVGRSRQVRSDREVMRSAWASGHVRLQDSHGRVLAIA